MNERWVGWCNDGNHDKVWMIVRLSGDHHAGRYATVWGRRGKKLQSKIHDYLTARERSNLIDSKEAKGYRQIPEKELNTVYPEFQDDLEKTTVWALLST
jgi:predicted DNA-binding WGR domain protein